MLTEHHIAINITIKIIQKSVPRDKNNIDQSVSNTVSHFCFLIIFQDNKWKNVSLKR